jgi:hypothetical protein
MWQWLSFLPDLPAFERLHHEMAELAPALPLEQRAFVILGSIAYAAPPIAIVTKLGIRQSRFARSSASEASQISSRVSIASPTGRSCLTNKTPGLRRRCVNCRKCPGMVSKSWEIRILPSSAANASTMGSGTASSRAACALRKFTRGSRRTAPRTIALRRSLSA